MCNIILKWLLQSNSRHFCLKNSSIRTPYGPKYLNTTPPRKFDCDDSRIAVRKTLVPIGTNLTLGATLSSLITHKTYPIQIVIGKQIK